MNLNQDLKCSWGFNFGVFLISFSWRAVQPGQSCGTMLGEWSANGFMIHIQAEAGPHRSPIPRPLTAHCFRHSGVGRNCTWGRVAYFSVLLFSCGLEQAESQTTLRGAGDSSNSSNSNNECDDFGLCETLKSAPGAATDMWGAGRDSGSLTVLLHSGRLDKTGFDGLPCTLAFSENVLFRVNDPEYPRSHWREKVHNALFSHLLDLYCKSLRAEPEVFVDLPHSQAVGAKGLSCASMVIDVLC